MSDDSKALVPVTEEARDEAKKASKPLMRAPALIEAAYAVSLYTVVVATAITAILSLLAGADLLMVAVRGGSVVLVLGGLAWVFNYLLMHGTLAAAVADLQHKRARAQAEESISMGQEWKA